MFIDVQDRKTFDRALQDISEASIMAADTETNGLEYYTKHYIISVSVYLPEIDTGYNFAFRNGEGYVQIEWKNNEPFDISADGFDYDAFAAMSWQGKAKKQVFLSYWFERYYADNKQEYNNLPISWLDELKAVWAIPETHVYHNARFDLHMLEADGFPRPKTVIDTMIQAHLILEDWNNIEFDAPYTYTRADVSRLKKLGTPVVYGTWAKDANGVPLTKKQMGNRRLKWQSAYLQHRNLISREYDATEGETKLHEAKEQFEERLVDYIMGNLTDPTVATFLYAAVKRNGLSKVDAETVKKQHNRIRNKIELDSKANMWMLPGADVAYYAILDTWLTWKLHQWQVPILEKWDNVELAKTSNAINSKVAWLMEHNGAVLDKDAVQAEIARLKPQIEEVQLIFDDLCEQYGLEPHTVASSKALPESLAVLLGKELTQDVYPEWWSKPKPTKTYNVHSLPNVRKETLDKYEENPVVQLVLEYRRMQKTSTTYLSRWLYAAGDGNIVRTGMKPDGTIAGRFSSGGLGGNWQNIPTRGGYRVAATIVPPSDEWMICGIDYGQLEARLASWIAEQLMPQWGVHNESPVMSDLFEGKYDIDKLRKINPDIDENKFLKGDGSVDMHAFTREMVNVRDVVYPGMDNEGILLALGYDLNAIEDAPEDIVSAHCRHIAKTMNFGLLYGGTQYMLSKLLKIELAVAEPLVLAWRDLFPAFSIAQDYYTEQSLTRRKTPDGKSYAMYATQPITKRHRRMDRYKTWLRYMEDGIWKGFNPREASAKKVWNNVVQGIGGYMTPYAVLRFLEDHGDTGFLPFAIIHDAVDFYVHRSHLDKVFTLMEYMVDFDVYPGLTVDLEYSPVNWQDMHPLEGNKKVRGYTPDEWIAEYGL